MDRFQRSIYRLKADNDFLRFKRQEFEGWFGRIMGMAYPDDYEPVRLTQGDGGLDGLLISTATVLAVYAPRECTEAGVVKKMYDDFAAAKKTMEERGAVLEGITFVHNDEGLTRVTAPELVKLRQANPNPEVTFRRWTFDAIWREIAGLGEDQLVDLYGHGSTDENVDRLQLETIRGVIERLRKADAPPDVQITLPNPRKLEHNDLPAEYADLLRTGRRRQGLVGNLVRGLTDPETGEEIAEGFRQTYAAACDAGANAEEIFTTLWRYAGGEHFVQPPEVAAVASVLAYFFDSCDIFENAPAPE